MVPTPRLYFRDPPDFVVIRRLDDLTLLYHRPSAMTHLLDSPMPEILAQLQEMPEPVQAILERLSRAYDLEGTGKSRMDGLDDHLRMLVSLGLARMTS